jgi:hypothetical protein
MENFLYSPPDPSKRYGSSLVLTPQASAFVHGGLVLADGTVQGSSSRLLVEFPLERYELYAHIAKTYRESCMAIQVRATDFPSIHALPHSNPPSNP